MQVRGAVLGLTRETDSRRYRGEGILAYAPSERSALRLQYAIETLGRHDTSDDAHSGEFVQEIFLQLIVSLGAHPAHAY